MKPSALLIGIAAGVAAALLFAGLVLQSATAVVLSLAAPIPIFIASLGWGSVSGFIAAGTAGIALAATLSSLGSGLLLLSSMALPAAIAGHLAGLARATGDAAPTMPMATAQNTQAASPQPLDWYPLSRILFAIASSAAAGCLFIGWLVGYDPATLAPEIAAALTAQLGAGSDAATETQIQDLARLMVQVVPFVQPALLVVVLVAGLHIASVLVRMSGRLPRPKDDIPLSAALPRVALPVFALALAGCFAGGAIAILAAVVAGTFGIAFTLVGLASLHRRTRGTANRGLLLFSAYASIVFLSFPLIAATVLGVFETARRQEPQGAPD
ncbi:MAG: hypothetical protein H7Y08_11725 [Rhizobiaceae bacterium]|nr:hypothetical protein [Rhizobiaceae bacterium]